MDPMRLDLTAALADAGRELHARGWMLATGGNLSAALPGGRFLMTASGGHKGRLGDADFLDLAVDAPLPTAAPRPSAEAVVHQRLYASLPSARAVLHVHAPYATLVSRQLAGHGFVRFGGYEFVKALGYWDEGAVVDAPIVANHHAIPLLAEAVRDAAVGAAPCPGVLVAGHGLYAWGDSVAAAQRHVEAFEFLCQMVWLERREG